MHAQDPQLPDACSALDADLVKGAFDQGDRGLTAELELHLSSCGPCASRLVRMRGQVDALRGLPRLEVPGELTGRVVAALQAGHRQDRATDALTALDRRQVPTELDRLDWTAASHPVSAADRRPVPSVLDRLVDETLHDLPRSVSRRLLGRLPRQKAPAALDARVEALLAAPERLNATGLRGLSGRLNRRMLAIPGGLTAAALLFLAIQPMLTPGPATTDSQAYPFHVVRRDAFDPSAHSTATLDLLESMTGQTLRRRM